MKYGGLTLKEIEAILNKLGGMEGVGRFLRGETKIVESGEERHTHAVRFTKNGESIAQISIPEWAGKVLRGGMELVPLDPITGSVLKFMSRRKMFVRRIEGPTHALFLEHDGSAIGMIRMPEWTGKELKGHLDLVPLGPITGSVELK